MTFDSVPIAGNRIFMCLWNMVPCRQKEILYTETRLGKATVGSDFLSSQNNKVIAPFAMATSL